MNNKNPLWAFLILLLGIACNGQQGSYKSPPGYDLNKPEKFNMPTVLHEISGIAFNRGNSDTIYAEQDEEGKIFHFKLGDKKIIVSKFGPHGDYEDVAICKGYVIMLRSDGTLFIFPLSEANYERAVNVKEWDDILPPGEYEGLSANDESGKLYILCKHCYDTKTSKEAGGFIFTLSDDGSIKASGNFTINVREIETAVGIAKVRFHPSALAENALTNDWYILSAVNKLLVITDSGWKVKTVYPLDPLLFPQPEGIAFDKNRNLYISNERNTGAYGTILKFGYQQK